MSAKNRRRNYTVIMGKFREHTVEEIRRLRNARQKRKRQQRAAEKLALEQAKMMKEREHDRRTASKLRETARKFCRKWREKCQENNKMRNLLLQYRPQVRFCNFGAGRSDKGVYLVQCYSEVAWRVEHFCHTTVYSLLGSISKHN